MSVRVYVPADATALALGADAVAAGIAGAAGDIDIQLVRNSSRGLFWLEPLVEVETPAGRIAYGPVRKEDLAGLFAAGFLNGGEHPLRLGLT